MDRRVLTTVLISMGILFVWTKYFAPPPPPTAQSKPSAAPAAGAHESASGTAKVDKAAQPATGPAAAVPSNVAKPPAQLERYEAPGKYRADVSSWGAAVAEWTLLDKQFQERNRDKKLVPINLVRTQSPNLPLTVTWPGLAADAAWEKQASSTADEWVYTADAGAAHVEKRFKFHKDGYQVDMKVVVENRGEQPLSGHLDLGMYGWQDPNLKAGGMFSPRAMLTEGACNADKLKHADMHALVKEPIEVTGPVHWIGIDEKYFVVAAAIKPGDQPRKCRLSAIEDGTVTAMLTTEERTVAAKQRTEYEITAFFGPKILDKLDDVKVGGVDAKLGDALNYGWTEALARPMLAVLKAVHVVVPNWGLAIIVLTMLLKAATWWPTVKSMKSMKAMAKLKPEMDKIKEKYGNDKQRMNVEVMNLYKQHGVNPVGGCLPMLIQMPIYIALYSMLGNSVELYRSGFLWIQDMTAPDPYFVMPLLTGAMMFLQQKLSPTPPDPQQKAMMVMMPVMFTAFSIFLPAGLTIYILTNTLLTMVQQLWLNRGEPRPATART